VSEEDDLKRIFFLECEELLGSAEQSVEALRDESAPESAINALFRSVHSVKGGAGAFGIDRLATFAHAFETFMDRLRKGRAELDQAGLDLLFDGVDVLRMLVDEAREGTPAPVSRYETALSGLRQAAGIEAEPQPSVEPETVPAPEIDAAAARDQGPGRRLGRGRRLARSDPRRARSVRLLLCVDDHARQQRAACRHRRDPVDDRRSRRIRDRGRGRA
jgi:chemotaxis protein histidine kinase CheA